MKLSKREQMYKTIMIGFKANKLPNNNKFTFFSKISVIPSGPELVLVGRFFKDLKTSVIATKLLFKSIVLALLSKGMVHEVTE